MSCPQTDTSDPEKVVSAFLKVASVFRDEASVKTAVLDAIGKGREAGLVDLDAFLNSALGSFPKHTVVYS